ncbi:MAG: hypothetical protein P8Z30_06750 [Acidobacteriota bacterium]
MKESAHADLILVNGNSLENLDPVLGPAGLLDRARWKHSSDACRVDVQESV